MKDTKQEKTSILVAKNSIYLMTAQTVSKFLTFVYYIIIARYLGDTGIGKYAFIINLVGMLNIVSNFGLENLMVRDIAIYKEKAVSYLSNVSIIKIIFALMSSIFLFVIINLMHKPPDVKLGVYLICLTIFTEGIVNTLESIFNAYEKLKYVAYIDVIVNILKVIIAILIKLMNLGLTDLLIGVVLLSGIRLFLGIIILSKKFFRINLNLDLKLIKYLLNTAYPFALMGIITVIYFRIDTIILSLMKDDSAVGWYAASFNFVSMLMFLSYAFCRAVFPVMSRSFHTSKQRLLEIGEKSVNFLLIIGLPIAVGITILADKIIYLIYGEAFLNSIWAIKILIWSIPLIYINSPLLRILYSADRQKTAMLIVFTGMVVNIILNFILIPSLSYIGASISTVLSEVISFFLYYIIISRVFSYKIKLNRLAIRSSGALIFMGFFIYAFKDFNIFFVFGSSVIIYSLMLFLLKAFSQYEINLMKSLVQGR